jgi:hypothetical protein
LKRFIGTGSVWITSYFWMRKKARKLNSRVSFLARPLNSHTYSTLRDGQYNFSDVDGGYNREEEVKAEKRSIKEHLDNRIVDSPVKFGELACAHHDASLFEGQNEDMKYL